MERFRAYTAAPFRVRATVKVTVVATLCVLSSNGCLFDAREADPPGSAGAPSVTLDAPQKVFVAMGASFEKDNDADYERALSDGFLFSPLQDDSLDQTLIGTGVYDNWTKDVELDVLRLLQSESNLGLLYALRKSVGTPG